MNILILEDNAHVSDRLKNLIEKNVNNAEVFLCSNVDEAWLKINKYRIDLFLLDIILDGKNKNDSSGILFAQSVREIAKYKMTPIIFVTSLIGWEADLLKTILSLLRAQLYTTQRLVHCVLRRLLAGGL